MAVFSVPVLAPELARLLGVSPSLVGPYVAIVYGLADQPERTDSIS